MKDEITQPADDQLPDQGHLVQLAQSLVHCPSITPDAAGCENVLARYLQSAGFRTLFAHFGVLPEETVGNWLFTVGSGSPHLVFVGHFDVVPPGDPSSWRFSPFSAELADGMMWGRGIVDMKGSVAAFAHACSRILNQTSLKSGQISLMLTSDEEGSGRYGIRSFLPWLEREHGIDFDAALVGEPTCQSVLGDTIKIGRRGSSSGTVTVEGSAGHSAYPERCQNPLPALVSFMNDVSGRPFDSASAGFAASTFSWIDVASAPQTDTWNVTPSRAQARFNIRWNDRWSHESLSTDFSRRAEEFFSRDGVSARVDFLSDFSAAFVSQSDELLGPLRDAVKEVTGQEPANDTGGGTSDARHIHRVCPVVEFGPVGTFMHQVDERISLEELDRLSRIYERFLVRYFSRV